MRYQPVGPGKDYTEISFGDDTRAKLHCEPNKHIHHPIFAYADKFNKKPVDQQEDLLKDMKPKALTEKVPTGDSDKLGMI